MEWLLRFNKYELFTSPQRHLLLTSTGIYGPASKSIVLQVFRPLEDIFSFALVMTEVFFDRLIPQVVYHLHRRIQPLHQLQSL